MFFLANAREMGSSAYMTSKPDYMGLKAGGLNQLQLE